MYKRDLITREVFNIPAAQLELVGFAPAEGVVYRGYYMHAKLAGELERMLRVERLHATAMGNRRPPPKFTKKWLASHVSVAVRNIIAQTAHLDDWWTNVANISDENIMLAGNRQYVTRGLLEMKRTWLHDAPRTTTIVRKHR